VGGLVSSYVVGHLTTYPVNLSITPDIVKDANNRLKCRFSPPSKVDLFLIFY
jgi:hypothetical protein